MPKSRSRPLRGTSPRSPNQLAIAERGKKALQYRLAGLSFPEIAERLGYASHSGAQMAVKRAMESTMSPIVEEYRAINLARLERALYAIWPNVLRGEERMVDQARKLIHEINDTVGVYAAPPTVQVNVNAMDDAKTTVGVGIQWTPDAEWMRKFAEAYDEIHPGEYDSAKLLGELSARIPVQNGADGPGE